MKHANCSTELILIFFLAIGSLPALGQGSDNSPPQISSIPDQLVQMNGTNGPVEFVVWDAETAATALTVSATSSNLLLVPLDHIAFGGGDSNRTVRIWPITQRHGKSLITIAVSDGEATNSTSFVLTVNSPPQFQANNLLTVTQGGWGTVTRDLLRAVDAESSPDRVMFTVAPSGQGGPPHFGWLQLHGTNLTWGSQFSQQDINDGLVIYQHDGGCGGNDDFNFGMSDGDGGFVPPQGQGGYSFKIQILLGPMPPIALNDTAQTPMGRAFTGRLYATNPACQGRPFTFWVVTNGVRGTLTITNAAEGNFVYTPNPGEVGEDQVLFQVSDGVAQSVNPGVFTITILNTPPVANAGAWTGRENTALAGALTASDPDLPAQAMTFTIVSNASRGSVVITNPASGGFLYTPHPGRFGPDAFLFRVNDGWDDSAPAEVTLMVRPVLAPGRLLGGSRGGLVTVADPGTGEVGLLSQGTNLFAPVGLAVEASGSIVAADYVSGLVRIDPATGSQTLLVSTSKLVSAVNVAVETNGNLLVTDMAQGLFRFDPQGTLLTSFPRGTLQLAAGVTVAPNSDIFVTDAAAMAGNPQGTKVVRINPQTLGQATVTTNGFLTLPIGMAFEPGGTLLVGNVGSLAGGSDCVVRVDPSTGTQTLLASSNLLSQPYSVAVDQTGAIFASSLDGSVIGIDPLTGAQSRVVASELLMGVQGLAVVPGALPAPEIKGIVKTTPGYRIRASGLAGRRYELVRSASVSGGEWNSLGTQQASLLGAVEFEDMSPLEGSAFYRVRMR